MQILKAVPPVRTGSANWTYQYVTVRRRRPQRRRSTPTIYTKSFRPIY